MKVTVQSRAGAYDVDIGPGLLRGLAEDPMAAFRQSGYLDRITAERAEKNRSMVSSYA